MAAASNDEKVVDQYDPKELKIKDCHYMEIGAIAEKDKPAPELHHWNFGSNQFQYIELTSKPVRKAEGPAPNNAMASTS